MAFDFLGNIKSLEDWKEFEEFVLLDMATIDDKIENLNGEISRFNKLLLKFKKADQILTSDYVLSKMPDADYIIKARSTEEAHIANLNTITGIQVAELKEPLLDNIKTKRERNEWKIKRIRDLIEQYQNEILMLENRKITYEDSLKHIYTKFGSKDYPEIQITAKLDQIDVDPSLRLYRKHAGKYTKNGITYYAVLSINKERQSITFDTIAPSLALNSVITLTNGLNNGDKVVTAILNSTTIKVQEPLLDEAPATTLVNIKEI